MPVNFSVVIPTYNSGRLVEEAIGSALAQTRPPAEVIVVDDGSTDDTADRLARFGPPVRVVRQANAGVAAARNRGVIEATGDTIAFLDADDVWHPRKLELQLTVLASRPDLGVLGTGCYDWPTDRHPDLPADPPDPTPVSFERLVVRNRLVTSTVAIRAGILKHVGRFDTDQRGTEDHDLWVRAARHTGVAVLPVPLAGYRSGTPGSLSKNAAQMEAGMRIILRKLEDDGAFAGCPLLRRRAWGYFRYSAAFMHLRAGLRGPAVRHAVLSLIGYPLGYPRDDVRYRGGRVRLLIAAALGRRPR